MERINQMRRERANDGTSVFNGYLSPASIRTIKRRLVTWLSAVDLYRASKHPKERSLAYPSFVTLTLPSEQIHDDREIRRRCLLPFIQALKVHGVRQYFYRCEAQENGRIHFHLIVDKYLDKEIIHELWLRSINLLGYVDRYEDGDRPPCTHVAAIKVKDRNGKRCSVVNYVTGYVLKVAKPEDGTRPISGRMWGMSDGLRELRPPRMEANEECGRELSQMEQRCGDFYTCYYGKVLYALPKRARGLVRQYYQLVFDVLYRDLELDVRLDDLWIDIHSGIVTRLEWLKEHFLSMVERSSRRLDTLYSSSQWLAYGVG